MTYLNESFLENLYLGLIIIDSDLNVQYTNSWIKDHTKYSSDLDDKPIFGLFDIFPESKDSSIEKGIKNTIESGMSNLLSNRLNESQINFFRNKYSKEIIPTRLVITPLHRNNERCALMQVFDMSQVYDRERFLIKKSHQLDDQRERSANSARLASIGEMAGGIAHEINNPLTIIQASTDKLYKLIKNDNPSIELISKKLDSISKTTKRIAKIVNGIRNISRSPNEEDFEPIALREIIEDVLSIFSERLKSSDIQLKVDMESKSFNQVFYALKLLLYQVFVNLLNNSYDAIIDSENEKWISIEAEDRDKDIRINYTDSGNGIGPEVIENIFVPFYTTKDVGKGTGLGMSTVYKIIMAHHGDIFVDDNHPNTRFTITLPKSQPALETKKK